MGEDRMGVSAEQAWGLLRDRNSHGSQHGRESLSKGAEPGRETKKGLTRQTVHTSQVKVA